MKITYNSDLKKKIGEWAHQWKLLLNSDPRKQATEVHFSRKQDQDSPLSLLTIHFNP